MGGPSLPKNSWECTECGTYNPLDENICEECRYDQDGLPPDDLDDLLNGDEDE